LKPVVTIQTTIPVKSFRYTEKMGVAQSEKSKLILFAKLSKQSQRKGKLQKGEVIKRRKQLRRYSKTAYMLSNDCYAVSTQEASKEIAWKDVLGTSALLHLLNTKDDH
jgi:hypothetical protein